MTFGERILKFRKELNLTQNDVAKKLKLHLTQYRRYEAGETEIPSHIIKELAYFYAKADVIPLPSYILF